MERLQQVSPNTSRRSMSHSNHSRRCVGRSSNIKNYVYRNLPAGERVVQETYYCPKGVEAIINDMNRVVRDKTKTDRDSAVDEQSSSLNACCVCMRNTKNVVLIPCTHLATCLACFDELVRRSFPSYPSCPICRSHVAYSIKARV